MTIIDATPPADLPDIVLVMGRDGFWLRFTTPDGVDFRTLANGATLPGARAEARTLGFDPAAWVDAHGFIHRF